MNSLTVVVESNETFTHAIEDLNIRNQNLFGCFFLFLRVEDTIIERQ